MFKSNVYQNMLMSNKILHVKKGAEKACLKRAIELQAVASDPNQKKFFFLNKKKNLTLF